MRSPFLFAFDLEIDRTFCFRRKKLRVEEQKLTTEAVSSLMSGIGGDQRRTLLDFVTIGVQGISSSIAWPTLEANNFVLKTSAHINGVVIPFRTHLVRRSKLTLLSFF